MLKSVLFLILFWWALSLGRRFVRGFRKRPEPRPPARPAERSDLADLTQQDIDDADYEEIP